jgi:hypothetical protein
MKTINIRGKEFEVHSLVGRVASAGKQLETIVSGGGGMVHNGNGGSRPVSSRTVVHDQLFLVDNSGREHAVKLVDWDIAVREGHVLGLTWLIRKGENFGPYVIVHNETTGETRTNKQAIKKLAQPGAFGIVAAAASSLVLSAVIPPLGAFFSLSFFGILIGGFAYRAHVGAKTTETVMKQFHGATVQP